MKAADLQVNYVQQFCGEICENSEPVIVACSPQIEFPENECFELVAEKIKEFGGEQVLGWAIWEKPGVFIEAEFHSVWKQSNGELLDLNPRPEKFGIRSILFVPDKNAKYEGKQIDNVRKQLVDDKDVARFLYLTKKRFQILNRGSRAYEYGEISLNNKELKEFRKLVKEASRLEKAINKRYGLEHS